MSHRSWYFTKKNQGFAAKNLNIKDVFKKYIFRPKFPIFDPSTSMTSKVTASKIYLFISNLGNDVEIFGDSPIPETLFLLSYVGNCLE